MKTELQLKIIYKIKELRENENISQAHLSDIIDVNTPSLVGNIESPKFNHKYTIKQIIKISEYFNYPIKRIFLSDDEISEYENCDLLLNKILIRISEYNG